MSVINQMLQELEQRRADAGTSAAQVRAVAGQRRRKSALWIVPLLGMAAIAAALGYWIAGRQVIKVPAPSPVVVSAPPAVVLRQPEKMPQVLQLAGELGRLPAVIETAASQPVPRAQAAEKALVAPVVETPKPAAAAEPVRPVEINKDIKQTSPQQRAENAYRQAYASLQQGRMGEAEESLRQALQYDPRHAAARQALAALLVEAKQLGRAEQLLQQGLELQPGHPGYAMTLARLQVERGDVAAALATLQRNPPSGENAEYHGFMAALLQRSERHKEAIEQYQIALRSNPGAGPWLLGLGISLQADNQPAKAAEVFRRAKSSSTLSPELQAFAEQRLKQLQ
ncbi:MAG: tetratricopeptide repeat protein [Sulfurimicrobium sp.]|nr:tetratricopeptide repeat protein [Sulfurimicrobium sp.]